MAPPKRPLLHSKSPISTRDIGLISDGMSTQPLAKHGWLADTREGVRYGISHLPEMETPHTY